MLMSESSDQALCAAFENGAAASRRGELHAVNPYRPSEDRWFPWRLGWLEEEGPVYSIPQSRKDEA